MLIIPIVFGAVLAFLLGWNNSGVIMGSSYGCGVSSINRSRVVIGLGVMSGAFMEGNKMSHTVFGGLTSDTLPLEVETTMVLAIFLTSTVILFTFSMLRIPSSLSLIAVGASMGAILGLSLTLEVNYALVLVASWLSLPLLSAFLTMLAYQPITLFVSKFSLAGADLITRLSATLGIFILSYVLGANNVGFINGLYAPLLSEPIQVIATLAISASTIIGVVLFGRAITEVIGERFVVLSPQGVFTSMTVSAACVWVFTQGGIPISITYALIGSIVGAALVKRIAILNIRVLHGIVFGATGSVLLSCILAFFIMRILFR